MRILDEEELGSLEAKRNAFLLPLLESYRDRRGRGQSNPVLDFLFTYYQMNRKILLRWRPMSDMRLQGMAADRFLQESTYQRYEDGIGISVTSMRTKDRERLNWIRNLIESALSRTPRFSCFGLHEWAMVYKSQRLRHSTTPLRVSDREIESTVERSPINCTHYDAFRFFTSAARPLNVESLDSEDRLKNEQFGCVHFNMDLYRWSYKLSPWIGSELLDDCFRLAIKARELDMRASPYDLVSYGYEAIPIETAEGREIYQIEQKRLFEKGQPLARRLWEECNFLSECSRRSNS